MKSDTFLTANAPEPAAAVEPEGTTPAPDTPVIEPETPETTTVKLPKHVKHHKNINQTTTEPNSIQPTTPNTTTVETGI